MVETTDLDVLKDIPGYKAILKALIKSQIQHLVEQLSCHTDEECVLLSASLSDGSLSHLGSEFGKKFLDNHDLVKKQFLGFCLKKQLHTPTPATSSESPSHTETPASFYDDQPSRTEFKQRKNRPSQPSSRSRLAAAPYADLRPNRQSPVSQGIKPPSSASTIPAVSHSAYSPSHQSLPTSSGSAYSYPTTSNTSNAENPFDTIISQGMKFEGQYGVTDDISTGSLNKQFGNNDLQAGSSVSDNNENKGQPNDVKAEPGSGDDSELEITGVDVSGIDETNWSFGNQSSSATADLSFERMTESQLGQDRDIDQFRRPSDGCFACPFCPKIVPQTTDFTRHLRTHTGEKPFACNLCGQRFSQNSSCYRHIRKIHKVTNSEEGQFVNNLNAPLGS